MSLEELDKRAKAYDALISQGRWDLVASAIQMDNRRMFLEWALYARTGRDEKGKFAKGYGGRMNEAIGEITKEQREEYKKELDGLRLTEMYHSAVVRALSGIKPKADAQIQDGKNTDASEAYLVIAVRPRPDSVEGAELVYEIDPETLAELSNEQKDLID